MQNKNQSQNYLGKQHQELCSKVKASLLYLGFDFSNLGAQYLQDIIIETIKCPPLIHSLVTVVYGNVACIHKTTTQSVERAARLAIIKAHKFGLIKEISYFNNKKAPTIKQLVNFIYDYFIEFDNYIN